MKASCIICSEYFKSNDDVSATTCGHLFHATCLRNWLKQSPTCPQCRSFTSWDRNVVKKIYLEVDLDASIADDVDGLKNKINELQADMTILRLQITELNTAKIKVDVEALEAVRNLCAEKVLVDTLKIQNIGLKTQINELKSENVVLKEKAREAIRLKATIKEYDAIKKLVTNSSEEIAKLHVEGSGDKQWIVACGVLKKVLNQTNVENNQLKQRLKHLNGEYFRFKRQSQTELDKYRNAQKRQPSAVQKKASIRQDGEKNEKKENAKPAATPEISAVDGPNASVASRAAARLSNVMPSAPESSSSGSICNEFNIMKRRRMISASVSKNVASGGYDGMGGHSRPDVFPSGRKLQ